MARKQPGVMLYFDIRPCLKRLTLEEKGLLFESILNYGELGELPELDGAPGIAWDFIQTRLDRDRERYEEVSRKRTAAINSRWDKEREVQMCSTEYMCIQPVPTTTTPSTPTASSTSTTSSTLRPLTEEQSAENLKREKMLSVMNWNG